MSTVDIFKQIESEIKKRSEVVDNANACCMSKEEMLLLNTLPPIDPIESIESSTALSPKDKEDLLSSLVFSPKKSDISKLAIFVDYEEEIMKQKIEYVESVRQKKKA